MSKFQLGASVLRPDSSQRRGVIIDVASARRLLLADEVGLGKTIEAGHIMLELKARRELQNVLIVCPKSLQEKWKLDESLFGLLKSVAHILKPKDSFMVLNLYSNGYSAALGETLVREAFELPVADGLGLTSGELALPDPYGKTLPLSIYVRLTR